MAKVRTNHPRLGGVPMAVKRQGSRPVDYPESDGKPLAETEIHLKQIFGLYASLCQHFAGRPEVHVSSNLLFYYEKDKPSSCVAPDLMIVFGIAPGLRRTYKLWEEGKVPDVVIEVTSEATRLEDRGNKKEVYATLGVKEYYMIDPTGDYLKPPLRAWTLRQGEYIEVISQPLESDALGLELRLVEGRLRFADPATGRLLPIPEEHVREIAAARAESEERVRQAVERVRQAEVRERLEARARAESEERVRQAVERARQAEVRERLEAEARATAEECARRALDEGRNRGRVEVAREMLAQGMDRATVLNLTRLRDEDLT